jgi:hypothetical protein
MEEEKKKKKKEGIFLEYAILHFSFRYLFCAMYFRPPYYICGSTQTAFCGFKNGGSARVALTLDPSPSL